MTQEITLSLRFHGGKSSLVAWMICFSDLIHAIGGDQFVLKYILTFLWISSVSVVCPLLISYYINLCLFHLFLNEFWLFGKGFIGVIDFLKEPPLCFIDSLNCSICFYFIDFCPQIDYVLSPTLL